MRVLFKIIITALVVTGVSELGKRFSVLAAVLASLPLTSILAILWLYWDTNDLTKVSDLSYGIFWAVLPSLLFFLILPLLIKQGVPFGPAMFISCTVMAVSYFAYIWCLKKMGISIS